MPSQREEDSFYLFISLLEDPHRCRAVDAALLPLSKIKSRNRTLVKSFCLLLGFVLAKGREMQCGLSMQKGEMFCLPFKS